MFRPLTVQTDGVYEVRVTVRPELELAPEANGVDEKVRSIGLLNVISCGVLESTGKV